MTRRLDASALHPDLRRVLPFIPNPPIGHGWQRLLIRSGMRLLPPPRAPEGLSHSRVDLGPGTSVHVYAPELPRPRPRGALLWIHGGGMVIGGAAQDHARCFGWARELDLVVVSVDYRLAPEHPYPAPLDDCFVAWQWLLAHADELGIDLARIAIGGQSAGGGLAAGLVHRLHDSSGTPPAAQWLFCPMLDDRTAADRDLDGLNHFVWNNRSNLIGWTAYLGDDPGGPDVAEYAAPARRRDVTGLPPAWIGTGDIELFYDENRRYAEALTAAGVPCTLDVVPGGAHGFESVAAFTPVAKQFLRRAERWLADQLEASDGGGGRRAS